jgi:hypothetical protein
MLILLLLIPNCLACNYTPTFGRGSLVSWNIPSLESPQLGHKAFLREDASHFGDMSSSGKTVSAGNPRESLDHQFKRLFAEARLSPFPLAQL